METIIKLHNPDTGDKREIRIDLKPLSIELHYETIFQVTKKWSAKGYKVLINEGGE